MRVMARSHLRSRLGDARARKTAEMEYTPYVISELTRALEHVQPLPANPTAQYFAAEHAAFSGQVIGLILVQCRGAVTPVDLLERHETAFRDFWHTTRYQTCTLLRFSILEAFLFERQEHVHATSTLQLPRALFFHLSDWSADRLRALVEDDVNLWMDRHGLSIEALQDDGQGRFKLGMCLQFSHAMLVLSSHWSSCLIPWSAGRMSTGMGWYLAKRLVHHLQIQPMMEALPAPDPATNDRDAYSADVLSDLANTLRRLYATSPSDEVRNQIYWLQHRRDAIVCESVVRTQSAYDLSFLLECLVMSGYLKNADTLKAAVRHAVGIGVRDPALQHHVMSRLRGDHVMPSGRTLRRHRLTLHIAFCRFEAELYENMRADGGYSRFGTMDSSPQGGHDWVLSGSRTIANKCLVPALKDAHRLCLPNLERDEKAEIQRRLREMLVLSQGVPTAVGSGRQSLNRKMHAVTHATRLVNMSWKNTVGMINAHVGWTGDMGTESGVAGFRAHLRTLFGQWPLNEDAQGGMDAYADAFDFHDNPGSGPIDGDGEFDFQDQAPSLHVDEAADADFDFQDTAPSANVDRSPDDVQPEEQAEQDMPVDDPYMIDCTGSIYAAGLLHVLHKAVEGLEEVLVFWPIFIDMLRHVCRLLSQKWSRQRFVETCCNTPALRIRARDLESFSGGVYEGRWGSVVSAIGQLLALEDLLRAVWNKEAFLRGGNEQARNSSNSLRVDIADSGLTSRMFWAFCRMLDVIGESIEELAKWGEGCYCCSREPRVRGPTRHLDRLQAQRDRVHARKNDCPLRTLQAPSMAAGVHFDILRRLLAMCNTLLLLDHVVCSLDPPDRNTLMADFRRARNHVQFVIRVKLSFWQQLPWLLIGVGHHLVEVAIWCARRALALFDQAGEDADHHWVSLMFCAVGTLAREQMTLFITRQRGLFDLPHLSTLVARLRWIAVVERWIESRHALMKRYICAAPHSSPAHLAFMGIQPPLRLLLEARPQSIYGLAKHCARVTTALACVKECGMWNHPVIEGLRDRLMSRRAINRTEHGKVVEILYHVDGPTLHGPLPIEEEPEDGPPQGPAPPPPPARPPFPPPALPPRRPPANPPPPGDDDDDGDDNGGGGGHSSGAGGCGGPAAATHGGGSDKTTHL